MIFNIFDNTTKLWMTKYIIGEIFSSGRATLYKDPPNQTVHHGHFKVSEHAQQYFVSLGNEAKITNHHRPDSNKLF